MTNEECNKRLWENAVPDRLNLCAGYIEGGIDSCQVRFTDDLNPQD